MGLIILIDIFSFQVNCLGNDIMLLLYFSIGNFGDPISSCFQSIVHIQVHQLGKDIFESPDLNWKGIRAPGLIPSDQHTFLRPDLLTNISFLDAMGEKRLKNFLKFQLFGPNRVPLGDLLTKINSFLQIRVW